MSGEGFLIRPMRSDDVERVLEIAGRMKNTPHWPRAAYLTALDPHAAPQRLALVAVDAAHDSPAGFAIVSLIPPGAELETIAVAKEQQRQGLGRALLDASIAELRKRHVCELWLEVRTTNEPAIELYRREGFAEIGLRKAYYVDPIEDANVMRVTLA